MTEQSGYVLDSCRTCYNHLIRNIFVVWGGKVQSTARKRYCIFMFDHLNVSETWRFLIVHCTHCWQPNVDFDHGVCLFVF